MRDTDDENLIRFETYRNYLHRFASHSESLHPTWESLISACADATRKLKPCNGLDQTWIKRFLGIAWNTESLLDRAPTEIEVLRISNAWLPVQAYYAVYTAAEAVAYSIDGAKADGHQKALRKITDLAVKLDVSPWNLAYSGAKGKDNKQHTPKNFLAGIVPAHNLAGSSASNLSIIATCLKAEHQNRIKEEYRRSKKHQYLYDPGLTSLLHSLYRLRIRSNYHGVELFIVSENEDAIREFTANLQKIVARTLCYLEVILLRRCTRETLLSFANNFISHNKQASSLQKRITRYQRPL
jgi:hypothetical protein